MGYYKWQLTRLSKGLCIQCNKLNDRLGTNCSRCLQIKRSKSKSPLYKATKIARQIRIKDEVFSHYGGYICNCCGEIEKDFLSIDHIIPIGNIKETRKIRKRLYDWIKQNKFPDNFQVLCMNCNFAKGKLGTCPHKAKSIKPNTASNSNTLGKGD